MKIKQLALAALLAAAALGSAHAANVASGQLWKVSEAVSQNAILANVPLTPADVTFDVNSPFNFSSNVGYSVLDFLNSSAAFNIVGAAGTLNSLLDDANGGTLMYFTGTVSVTTGQVFTVTHDDGLTLIIGGLDLLFSPGPTSPIQSLATYTGPSGNLAFQLVYGECCGAPAVLQVDLPFAAGVPEPETYALMFGGLGLVGFMARRRKA